MMVSNYFYFSGIFFYFIDVLLICKSLSFQIIFAGGAFVKGVYEVLFVTTY